MQHQIPRLVLTGLSGGAGKTIVSLALARAFCRRGLAVAPFKKGPDYIDARWLAIAAGRDCSNLDPFFHSHETLRSLFWHGSQGADLSLVEGNRGLFDGKDVHGSCSTSELARQLAAPVILVIDCTKMTRTVAAIVQGCARFESGLDLAGVILNRTAGERHRSVLRRSIEEYTDIPVLGMLPKLADNPIPERHMGLLSDQEFGTGAGDGNAALDTLADMAGQWLDLDTILAVARQALPMDHAPAPLFGGAPRPINARIGYVHDEALWFYYPENLEALRHAGAELVRLSVLSSAPWPDMDGLYLGGGFPEMFAERIAANRPVLERIRALSRAGMPIYAECGGFMLLCDALECRNPDGRTVRHAMAGVFPAVTTLCEKPQGLGYTEAVAESESPFFRAGETILGHEFHYSLCVAGKSAPLAATLRMRRGSGIGDGRDGLLYENTFAGYTHIHALAVPEWAPRFVGAAAGWGRSRRAGTACPSANAR